MTFYLMMGEMPFDFANAFWNKMIMSYYDYLLIYYDCYFSQVFD